MRFENSSNHVSKPTWRSGVIVTAPAAGAALVTVAAVAGRIHEVYGVLAGVENAVANLLQLREGATIQAGFSLGQGSVLFQSYVALLEAAANTAVSANVLNAGAAGIDHWAALLVYTR